MLAETITAEDIRAVLNVLLDRAKAAEPWAVKELLDRCLGKAPIGTAGELETTPVRICLVLDEGPAGVSRDDPQELDQGIGGLYPGPGDS